jgi:succinoglycan biosynthesis protein ExoL
VREVKDGNDKSDAGIVFFEPDLTETTTVARASEFAENGLTPVIFGFRRGRYNCHHVASWREIDLGTTKDAHYWQRIAALVGAIPAIVLHRRYLKSATVFLARNLDQLLLALLARGLFNRGAAIVYEAVDIQPAFTRADLVGAIIRSIERLCVARIDLLAVSSPAFHQNYFASRQRYRGDWVVVENRLRLSAAALADCVAQRDAAERPLHGGRKWVVGYFGLIRGRATIELMVDLAKHLPDLIEIHFRGVPTTVGEARFREMVAAAPNITFDGGYSNPQDLGKLYAGVDFAWAIDLENVGCNSRWLLPCRFYEAGLFGVPCLAVHDFEIGRVIDRLDVGWSFDMPLVESLSHFFETLDVVAYEAKRRKLLACAPATFAAVEGDAMLYRRVSELKRGDGASSVGIAEAPRIPETAEQKPVAAARLE